MLESVIEESEWECRMHLSISHAYSLTHIHKYWCIYMCIYMYVIGAGKCDGGVGMGSPCTPCFLR